MDICGTRRTDRHWWDGSRGNKAGPSLLTLTVENPAVLSSVASHLPKDSRCLLQLLALGWPWRGGGGVEKGKMGACSLGYCF